MKQLATYQRRGFLKDHPPVSARVLLGSGTAVVTLLAGTVLGLKADGKHYAYTAETSGDSATAVYEADCILAEDVTVPSAGDMYALAYMHAAVIAPELTWAVGVTAEQQKAAIKVLRSKGLYASEA
jgi:hypothetical protein